MHATHVAGHLEETVDSVHCGYYGILDTRSIWVPVHLRLRNAVDVVVNICLCHSVSWGLGCIFIINELGHMSDPLKTFLDL